MYFACVTFQSYAWSDSNETLTFNGASKKYKIYFNMIVLLRLYGNFQNLETREWKKKGDIRTIIRELLGVTHDSSSIRWDINFKIQLISPYL